jgi:hypothetical protein
VKPTNTVDNGFHPIPPDLSIKMGTRTLPGKFFLVGAGFWAARAVPVPSLEVFNRTGLPGRKT